MSDLPKLAIAGLAFPFGACVGSFVSVVAYRLPRELSIIKPRSFCPACRQALPAWVNVPLFGYIFLRGRCAMCRAVIPWRYPLVELALGAAALSLTLRFELSDALARFSLCTALLAVSLIDLEWRIIPDAISLPGIGAGIICATFFISEVGLTSSLLGVFGGAGLFWVMGEAYRWTRGREGLGFGDVKLLGMVGAYLGWPGALFTIFFGALFGSLSGLMLAIAAPRWLEQPQSSLSSSASDTDRCERVENSALGAFDKGQFEACEEPVRTVQEGAGCGLSALMQTQLPFAPFLSLAAAIYAIFQPELMRWYLGGE
jgi:leader peptidase (prepilin peptidase)/N-methyltransferase